METNLEKVKSKHSGKSKETEKINTIEKNKETEDTGKRDSEKIETQPAVTTKTVPKIFHMKLNLLIHQTANNEKEESLTLQNQEISPDKTIAGRNYLSPGKFSVEIAELIIILAYRLRSEMQTSVFQQLFWELKTKKLNKKGIEVNLHTN